MNVWIRRTLYTGMLAAGFLVLGSGAFAAAVTLPVAPPAVTTAIGGVPAHGGAGSGAHGRGADAVAGTGSVSWGGAMSGALVRHVAVAPSLRGSVLGGALPNMRGAQWGYVTPALALLLAGGVLMSRSRRVPVARGAQWG